MKSTASALLVALLAAASGCGSFAAAKKDTFYRMLDAPVSQAESAVGGEILYLPPFAASGLHGERALVYAHADGTTLEQYPYHFWVDSPRLLLQQALAAELRNSGKYQVVLAPSTQAGFDVRPRIVNFERRAGAGHGTAEVKLEFAVYANRSPTPFIERTYARSLPLANETMAACVAELTRGVQEIIGEFAADLAAHGVRSPTQ